QAFVFPGIVAAARLRCACASSSCRGAVGGQFLSFGCQRWDSSIWRIDNQRSLVRRFTALVPIVRRPDPDAIPAQIGVLVAGDETPSTGDPWIPAYGFCCVDFILLFRKPNALVELFLCKNGSGSQCAIAFEWCADHILARPQSLNVRISPWSLRLRP